MTKQDIIKEVATALNATPREARPMVEALFEELKTSLENGINVEITDFGKFGSRYERWRIGCKEAEIEN